MNKQRMALGAWMALIGGLATTWVALAQTAATPAAPAASAIRQGVDVVPGMPPVADPANLYRETGANQFSPAVAHALERVYVPNRAANTVSVIDPATLKVVDTFKVGVNPQHVVPSWDLRTLWVANNAEGRSDGSLTPIDPVTGKPGKTIAVEDPYNMELKFSIQTPACAGINHADFSIDGRFALFTCEFNGAITKVDLVNRVVLGTIKLSPYFNRPDALALIATPGKKPRMIPDPGQPGNEICTTPGMPQDVRASPDGKTFFVADMMVDGVHVVDGASFQQIGFIPTGVGAHGLYPSRDGKSLYVANRGGNQIRGKPLGKGSVSVIDFASRKVVHQWPIPGGGSPDMGNVSADGQYLWLSGRYDDVVYRIDTRSGAVDKVKVGREPHGLTVWPQPGRYSLGHTGNLR